jgi:xanthine/CO dehydrogenase XdhC/CoxF family maturation factor
MREVTAGEHEPSDAASETPIHFTPLPSRRWAALFALSVDPGARAHLSALHIDEGSLPFRSSQSDRDQDDLGPQVVQTLNSASSVALLAARDQEWLRQCSANRPLARRVLHEMTILPKDKHDDQVRLDRPISRLPQTDIAAARATSRSRHPLDLRAPLHANRVVQPLLPPRREILPHDIHTNPPAAAHAAEKQPFMDVH